MIVMALAAAACLPFRVHWQLELVTATCLQHTGLIIMMVGRLGVPVQCP